ncbi:IQ domain-containing GTPase activating protein [Gigaspora margarita]|uniref:IQ domain-containing GTPase activating protein n=1 Tax=Gigaspora margarita TaxID=4874 RepID=A0A8H3XJH2_GIGMA|nr:IQ domain-containing GTPase activating protein [Gigaspora margarita]
MESEQPITSPMFTNSLMMEPSKKLNGITSIVRDPSRSAVAELRRLSSMSVKKDLSDLQIPTITENAEDVTGLKGRIRLQKTDERRNSRNWADQQRKNLQAYEYLCHIGEAKEWIETCIAEEIDPIILLEESLRNGIVLAKLAKSIEPSVVRKIFMSARLQFRHSDNINYFFACIQKVGLPRIFWFELTDLYEKKNIPKVIYCIHALSHLLSRRGLTGRIKNLVGKLEFTDEQLHLTQRGLDASGVIMPSFANVGNVLSAELNEPPHMEMANTINASEEEEKEDVINELSEEEKMAQYWSEHQNAIVRCQAIARTHMARKHLLERRALHEYSLPFIVRLQSQIRGWLVRTEWNNRLNQMEKLERWVVNLQSLARGALARSKFRDRFSHYQKNVDKVIKIQSLYRAKHAGDAYRSLILGNNPPVTTIKNFIHLLNDSDFDFDEEIELERLRQAVIQRIRENNQSEDLLNQLDIKIALLVKNRITIDEVLAVANSKKRIRRLSQLTSPQSPFSLKSLDKVSHRRLELYQQLFYLLQTQPMYLARLFFIMNKMSFPEKTKKLVEGVVLTLFGYAQNAREEYLLLKLFQKSMMQELENMDSLQEFLRGNFMFMKLVVHYNRGAKERKFLRDLLSPLVKQVMDDEFMDLETDPLKVYRNLINAEELRTGLPSNKPIDISQQDALNDPETRTVFIHHLQRLRKETENFLTTIINSIGKMPFGIRYIAKELKKSLMSKFSNESEDSVIKVVGHLIYYRYLNPAIVAPEGFDVIDTVVSPMQRKNLAEISKMLNQISVGKLFSEDNMYLQPLNEYVAYASDRFLKFFKEVTEVGEAESFFGIDEFDDLTKTNKPIIYISPIEVFSTHELLMQRLEDIAPQPNDILRQIFNELGEAPPIEEDLSDTATKEISLTLTSRLALEAMNDPDAEIKHLFVETKRLVLAVMRVQNGENLLDILVKAVTDQDEKVYAEICKTDKKNKDRQPVDGSNDITEMKFMDLKKLTLQNILRLEKEGKIFRRTNYQEILNAIAVDIRNKHRRRVQRQKELRQLRQTLVNLDEKRVHLDDQIKTYNDHIDVCMQQLTTKKGKKHRLVLPFTRQYFHIRELQKSGKVPRFGSFKYTAQRLREKGVLLSISGYSTFDKISFTISSDEVGIFSIEASYAGVPVPGASMELRLEDLLQSQFNNTQVMNLFDGVAKVNVNLLIFLINKKFFV